MKNYAATLAYFRDLPKHQEQSPECSHLFPSMLHDMTEEDLQALPTEWRSNGLTLDQIELNAEILRADKKRRMDIVTEALHNGQKEMDKLNKKPLC